MNLLTAAAAALLLVLLFRTGEPWQITQAERLSAVTPNIYTANGVNSIIDTYRTHRDAGRLTPDKARYLLNLLARNIDQMHREINGA